VTGLLAKEMVAESLHGSALECQTLALPVSVASLMSPEYIANALKTKDLSNIDLVLIPGLIKGDTSKIEEVTSIKTRKGPKNAADLPIVLKAIGKVKLSTTLPADEFVRRTTFLEAERALSTIKRDAIRQSNKREVIIIGAGKRRTFLGPSLPMLVLAEIVDASIMSTDEIERRARAFAASGVDIVDVGMVAGGGHPEEAARAVKAVKGCTEKPVSIDTGDPEEIEAAVAKVIGEDQSLYRKLCIHLSHQWSGWSLEQIGAYFGMKGSAVSQSSRRLKNMMDGDKVMRKLLESIRKEMLIVET